MKPEFRFPDERVAFWVPMTIRAAQVTPGGFGPRMIARVAPGTDRARLAAQLEPLAPRVQQRLGGPAPYVRIMELVTAQTACAVVLLVGAALLLRSFWRLSHVVTGYDTRNIFTFQIAAGRPDLNDRASVSRFQYAFMERVHHQAPSFRVFCAAGVPRHRRLRSPRSFGACSGSGCGRVLHELG